MKNRRPVSGAMRRCVPYGADPAQGWLGPRGTPGEILAVATTTSRNGERQAGVNPTVSYEPAASEPSGTDAPRVTSPAGLGASSDADEPDRRRGGFHSPRESWSHHPQSAPG